MKTNDTIQRTTGETLETQVDRYTEALLTLQPQAKHQKNELFTRLYPTIVALLSKHVSQKAILDMLQTQGLKLHPSRFRACPKFCVTGPLAGNCRQTRRHDDNPQARST